MFLLFIMISLLVRQELMRLFILLHWNRYYSSPAFDCRPEADQDYQFLHISDGRKPAGKQSSNHSGTPNSEDGFPRLLQTRPRSMSVGEELDVPNLSERMKHTRDFKKKGFKGNSRGDHIQAPFATLEELFKELPKSAGFNMELSELAILNAHDGSHY